MTRGKAVTEGKYGLCPECLSGNVNSMGIRYNWLAEKKMQSYRCKDCHAWFWYPVEKDRDIYS